LLKILNVIKTTDELNYDVTVEVTVTAMQTNAKQTRMRGKAQRDGRPAVKWMETFTRDQSKVRM